MRVMNLVESLRTNGYAQTTLDELFGTPYPQAVSDLTVFVEQFAASDKVRNAEDKFRRGEDRPGELKQFIAKLREKRQCEGGQVHGDVVGLFGKETPIINVVASATKPAKMYYIMSDIWYVIPANNARARSWSQKWHRDPESQCVIKVMVYFRDVDDDSGPFEYVRGSHLGSYSEIVPAQSYPAADIDQLIDPAEKVKFCVPAGTVIFANTSGLHRGGYTRSKPRLSGVWTYVG